MLERLPLCGLSICVDNFLDQYGDACGTPTCRGVYTQYGIRCSDGKSDVDKMDRKADKDNTCGGYRRLWNNSFLNNDPVFAKEMGALLTNDNKVILLPSYDNGATTTSYSNLRYCSNYIYSSEFEIMKNLVTSINTSISKL